MVAPSTGVASGALTLTDEQIDAIGIKVSDYDDPTYFRVMARAVEVEVRAALSAQAGTPLVRLSGLLSDLALRFPAEARPFAADAPECRYLKAIDALLSAQAPPAREPYGQVTTTKATGQQFFYRWPLPPYLDNASECVAVYLVAGETK